MARLAQAGCLRPRQERQAEEPGLELESEQVERVPLLAELEATAALLVERARQEQESAEWPLESQDEERQAAQAAVLR
jgi:hypothetical protein